MRGKKNLSSHPHLVMESVPVPEWEFGGQAWQVAEEPAAGVGEKVLVAQGVQTDAAVFENPPAAHDWQVTCETAPRTAEAVPAAHEVQVEASASANVPVPHWLMRTSLF